MVKWFWTRDTTNGNRLSRRQNYSSEKCTVKPQKIESISIDQLEVGDDIVVPGSRGCYEHHAIICEVRGDRFTVIELTGDSGDVKRKLSSSKGQKSRVAESWNRTEDYERKYSYTHLYKYNDESKRKDGFRPEEVAKLFYRDGLPQRYNFLEFNCEHFVTYCITGLPFSGQTPEAFQLNQQAKENLDRHIKIMKRLSDLKEKKKILDYWESHDGISIKHFRDYTQITTVKKVDIEYLIESFEKENISQADQLIKDDTEIVTKKKEECIDDVPENSKTIKVDVHTSKGDQLFNDDTEIVTKIKEEVIEDVPENSKAIKVDVHTPKADRLFKDDTEIVTKKKEEVKEDVPEYSKTIKVDVHTPKVHLDLKHEIKSEQFFQRSCCILPNGLLVVVCSCTTLQIHNSCGELRSTEIFKMLRMKDVTQVDDHSVAVSSYCNRYGTINIINIDSNKESNIICEIVKTINLGEKIIVGGLCCSGRDIFCCVKAKGIFKVNIDSEEVKRVKEDESVDNTSHVQVGNNLICYTSSHTDTVTFLDAQYNVTDTYADKAVLNRPCGVTIDDYNNIYVTGNYSHNLVLISPGGKSSRPLLENINELVCPKDVHYDNNTKTLVVVKTNVVYIFSVEYNYDI